MGRSVREHGDLRHGIMKVAGSTPKSKIPVPRTRRTCSTEYTRRVLSCSPLRHDAGLAAVADAPPLHSTLRIGSTTGLTRAVSADAMLLMLPVEKLGLSMGATTSRKRSPAHIDPYLWQTASDKTLGPYKATSAGLANTVLVSLPRCMSRWLSQSSDVSC